ncbi:MAG TPA: hypothetical protein VNF68_09580, partial [Candidatus Baltobacteraceae bacterium]|nr:hypothetical protein [Candidatus Baltobacteraceae bacterium]
MQPSQGQAQNPQPTFLFGREGVLLRAATIVATGMGAMSPVCLRISAPAGYGKTALLDALERSWRSDAGNIVFRAAARANVTRG